MRPRRVRRWHENARRGRRSLPVHGRHVVTYIILLMILLTYQPSRGRVACVRVIRVTPGEVVPWLACPSDAHREVGQAECFRHRAAATCAAGMAGCSREAAC
jgi:hypothetical protein